MHIESFRIDGFGIFANASAEHLPPGISIFLGMNEAGKSTCLEFLRTMLTGYPSGRGRRGVRDNRPLRGGQAGGALILQTAGGETLHLTRRPGPGDGLLTLTNAAGGAMPASCLERLLAGVGREMYRAVFGFSLSELENLATLNDEDIRNALYGASFGPGLRAPGEVLKNLERRMEGLFKSGGRVPRMNAALDELDKLQEKIDALAGECAGYDALAADLSRKKTALTELRQRKGGLEEELRQIERRLNVWKQWDEWRATGVALARLPAAGEKFPENGPARLARLQEARESCERQVAEREEKWQRISQRLAATTLDEALFAALPELRRLAERKTSYRQALSQLPGQEEACRRFADDLARDLARLGPNWDCDRIRTTDRSLFAREDIGKQAREMTAADAAHKAAIDALDRANHDVGEAERATDAAQNMLASLPTPVAALDDDARNELRQSLRSYEEGFRQLPERRRAVDMAHTSFMRAYDPLRIAAGEMGSSDPAAVLDKLLGSQEEALSRAGEVQARLAAADEAAKAVSQAQGTVNDIKNRMEGLRQSQRESGAPTREDLDARGAALRQLRTLSATIATEGERLNELDSRIKAERPNITVKSIPLLVIGGVLFAAGATILLAYGMAGITSYAITPTLTMPINLWSGYLVLVCGVGFLAGGAPRSGADARRHKQEMANLRNRYETCLLHLRELEDTAARLRAEAQVDSMDAVTLDATEMLLEREREACFIEELSRADMDNLKREMLQARTRLSLAQGDEREKDNAVQQARRGWHEFMQGLRVSNVPSPEAATAFFAKAESARLAFDAVTSRRDELERVRGDIHSLADQMRALPPIAGLLSASAANHAERDRDDEPDAALTSCARQVLEACREADNARERRIQAEAALAACRTELARCQDRQFSAAAALEQAEQRRKTADAAWNDCLGNLGLGDDLDPETVREAFKCMDACLAHESKLARARSDLEQTGAELAGLAEPLQALFRKLGRNPIPGGDGAPDWLLSLDAALTDAEEMTKIHGERERLSAQMTDADDDRRAARAALEEALGNEKALLAQAGAADAEEFLRQATLHEEARNLTRRHQDLEDQLTLAAGDAGLEAFLESFRTEDQERQENRRASIVRELKELEEKEHLLGTDVATAGARVARITASGELAMLRQESASQKADITLLARDWARLALTRAIVFKAKRDFERERQPEVIRQASEIFAAITDGRWQGISASLEDMSLRMLPSGPNEPTGPENLSRGAQEQAYLALRLACVKQHAARAEPLPLIMDDVLVNFDAARAACTAQAFARLAGSKNGSPPQQILYFTCHPHMADILRQARPDAAIYHVRDGSIAAA